MIEVTATEVLEAYTKYGLSLNAEEMKIILEIINVPQVPKAKKLELLERYVEDTFLAILNNSMEVELMKQHAPKK